VHQRPGSAAGVDEIGEEIEDLRVQNRRRFEMFPRRRSPGENKDTGANNRPDAERGQRPRPQTFFQPVSRLVRLSDQLINGLSGEELVAQWSAPSPDLPCLPLIIRVHAVFACRV
jgi:hypothetical protein